MFSPCFILREAVSDAANCTSELAYHRESGHYAPKGNERETFIPERFSGTQAVQGDEMDVFIDGQYANHRGSV